MGHVILPSGTTVYVDELSGSVNLSQLVHDMECEDYTPSYRVTCIAALGKIGKNAAGALSNLKTLSTKSSTTHNEKLLSSAAEQAIKRIEDPNAATSYVAKDNHFPRPYSSGYPMGPVVPTQPAKKTLEVHKIDFEEISADKLHDGLKVYSRCNFCEKMTFVTPSHQKFSEKLAGPDKFFCSFCLRSDYNQRWSRNVMALTYRGLMGYYYYSYYFAPKVPSMSLNELTECLELHVKTGLQNPLFRYDADTFCWFVDFSRVGDGKRQVPVESVLKTITHQLACFNMYDNVREASPLKLYQKYQQAVMEFHQHRARANGDKVFVPTLLGCDIPENCSAGKGSLPLDILEGFCSLNLVDRAGNRRNH